MAAEKPMEVVEEDDGSITVFDGVSAIDAGANEKADAQDDEDDDASPADESLKTGGADAEEFDADDDSLEAKRARRRDERRNKKTAQRERLTALQNELQVRDNLIANLSERLNAVEQRGTQSDVVQVESELRQAQEAAKYWKQVIVAATKKQDGQATADATENMLQCLRRADALTNMHQQAVQTAQQRQAAPQVNPAIVAQGTAWLRRNSWYNPQANDATSNMVRSMDLALAAEGHNPATPEYWDELDRRLKKHRLAPESGYTGGDASEGRKPAAARNTVAGSGQGGRAVSSDNGQYKLSAQRVQALKDAGMWENPKLRAEAIREYRAYDRKSSGR